LATTRGGFDDEICDGLLHGNALDTNCANYEALASTGTLKKNEDRGQRVMVIILIDNNGNVVPITPENIKGTITIKETTPTESTSSLPQTGVQAKAQDSDSVVKDAPTKEVPTPDAPIQAPAAKADSTQDDPAKDAPQDAPAEEPLAKDAAPDKDAAKTPIVSSRWRRYLKPIVGIVLVLIVGVAAYFIWQHFRPKGLGEGFASGNGRIEAVEFDVAAKSPGRIIAMYADDGNYVAAGQVVARMDTAVLQAQLKQVQAEEAEARNATSTALAIVAQRESEKAAAMAVVTQREAEQVVAVKTVQRSKILSTEHATSIQEFDNDVARQREAAAAVLTAKAQFAASQATINAARSQVLEARSKVVAAQAAESRLQAEIDETELKSAREGRVQYRIAQPGEVVAAGGKVLSMVDLSDVTMTFFLPEAATGRIAIGSEVRIVLDAAPQNVIPATVSFVANVAQFTPKTVETASEREKLVFRVKARIAPALLRKHAGQVKSGLPGMAYVRLDPSVPWPEKLKSRAEQ
jgi:HlyD family secretion protein